MMVVVLQEETSNAFQVGDSVSVNAGGSVNLRLGPGLNYAVLDAIPAWTSGVIQAHENDLNGVYAKGYHWWKVKFSDFEGWMAEPFLVKN
jgi:uncharacterized protein YraI